MAKWFISAKSATELEELTSRMHREPAPPGFLRTASLGSRRTLLLRIDWWSEKRQGWVVDDLGEGVPFHLVSTYLHPEPSPVDEWEVRQRETEEALDVHVDALSENTPLSEALFRLHQTRRKDDGDVTVRSREVAWLILQAIKVAQSDVDPLSFLGDSTPTVQPAASEEELDEGYANAGVGMGGVVQGCASEASGYSPVGDVRPRIVVLHERALELLGALDARTRSVGHVPSEWLQELCELNVQLCDYGVKRGGGG